MSKIRRARSQKAKRQIADLYENKDKALIIHYACESFEDDTQQSKANSESPRILAISVRILSNNTTHYFSINDTADEMNITLDAANLDTLEFNMLKDFLNFIENKKHFTFIHWNMKGGIYGLSCFDERLKKLSKNLNQNTTKIKPLNPENLRAFSLSSLFVDAYGDKYIGHNRFKKLCEKNKIPTDGLLFRDEEPNEFKKGNYNKVKISSNKKNELAEMLLQKSYEGTLKTDFNMEKYGSILYMLDSIISESPTIKIILVILAVLGTIASCTGLTINDLVNHIQQVSVHGDNGGVEKEGARR